MVFVVGKGQEFEDFAYQSLLGRSVVGPRSHGGILAAAGFASSVGSLNARPGRPGAGTTPVSSPGTREPPTGHVEADIRGTLAQHLEVGDVETLGKMRPLHPVEHGPVGLLPAPPFGSLAAAATRHWLAAPSAVGEGGEPAWGRQRRRWEGGGGCGRCLESTSIRRWGRWAGRFGSPGWAALGVCIRLVRLFFLTEWRLSTRPREGDTLAVAIQWYILGPEVPGCILSGTTPTLGTLHDTVLRLPRLKRPFSIRGDWGCRPTNSKVNRAGLFWDPPKQDGCCSWSTQNEVRRFG